jgi:hypothetical protein
MQCAETHAVRRIIERAVKRLWTIKRLKLD